MKRCMLNPFFIWICCHVIFFMDFVFLLPPPFLSSPSPPPPKYPHALIGLKYQERYTATKKKFNWIFNYQAFHSDNNNKNFTALHKWPATLLLFIWLLLPSVFMFIYLHMCMCYVLWLKSKHLITVAVKIIKFFSAVSWIK